MPPAGPPLVLPALASGTPLTLPVDRPASCARSLGGSQPSFCVTITQVQPTPRFKQAGSLTGLPARQCAWLQPSPSPRHPSRPCKHGPSAGAPLRQSAVWGGLLPLRPRRRLLPPPTGTSVV